MARTVSEFGAELADREAIRDCLYRYCRGIDRCDAELLRSAYWPDATDEHTVFSGGVEAFIEFAMKMLATMDQTQHFLGNILIDIEADTARVESYIRAFHRLRRPEGEPYDMITSGRYLDRMERRGDEWRIAHRVVVRDWFREYPDSADWSKGIFGALQDPGGRKPDDPSYALLNSEGLSR